MESLSHLVRESIPAYFRSVPIPKSFRGFGDLSAKEWIHLLAFTAAVSATTYHSFKPLYDRHQGKRCSSNYINKQVCKDKAKVCDIVDVEDLGESTAFCRCWKSNKFPYCDGSHNTFNEQTGDNVAPLIVKKSMGDN